MEAFLNATPQSSDEDKSKARWSISSSALYLLEQVFKIERFPSLHMRQRLAVDLGVTARQVRHPHTLLGSNVLARVRACEAP